MTEVHVVPDDRTATWRVQDPDAAAPVSEHTNATEAELPRGRMPTFATPSGSGATV